MKTYNIEIQNPRTGVTEIRDYTLISVTSLRARTSALRFQKCMLDLKILKAGVIDDTTNLEEKSESYDMALQLMDAQRHAYEQLCRDVLIGDWSNVEFDLIDESVVTQVLTDFFSLFNQKKED